jgi:hypothetical protein
LNHHDVGTESKKPLMLSWSAPKQFHETNLIGGSRTFSQAGYFPFDPRHNTPADAPSFGLGAVPSALGFGGEAVTTNCPEGEFTKSKERAEDCLCHIAFINTRLSLRQEAAGGVHEAKR